MAKQVFHDLSEIGALKKDFPYSEADLRLMARGLDRTLSDIKSLNRELSAKEKPVKKATPSKKTKLGKSKQGSHGGKPVIPTLVINNVVVHRSSPESQVAYLMAAYHKSMAVFAGYVKGYEEFFGAKKFAKIRQLVEKNFSQKHKGFVVGEIYTFKVVSSEVCDGGMLTDFVDKRKNHHKIITDKGHTIGQEYRCKIKGIVPSRPGEWQLSFDVIVIPERKKVQDTPKAQPKADAVRPAPSRNMVPIKKSKPVKKPVVSYSGPPTHVMPECGYRKSADKWFTEVDGLGYHKCGTVFLCDCCGRRVEAGKGYRIDFREIYFCEQCKREIFRPKGHAYVKLIYTNMGHK